MGDTLQHKELGGKPQQGSENSTVEAAEYHTCYGPKISAQSNKGMTHTHCITPGYQERKPSWTEWLVPDAVCGRRMSQNSLTHDCSSTSFLEREHGNLGIDVCNIMITDMGIYEN